MVLFRVMRNGPVSGTSALVEIEKRLRASLPPNWQLKFRREVRGSRSSADALLELTASEGRTATVVVEYKDRLTARDVPSAVRQARAFGGDGVMIAAPYLGPRTREVISELAEGYADATGNLRLSLDRPSLFISVSGAASDPWPAGEEPLRTLKGPGAGRVVRALGEIAPPYGVRALAKLADSPASTTSRVVALLDREALVTRDPGGRIVGVDWQRTIRRWAHDYSLLNSNRTSTYMEPRGLQALLTKLRRSRWTYSVTGSLAAAARADLTAPRLGIVFVADMALASERLMLLPAESGANVILAEPFDGVAFERTWTSDGVNYAGLAQVAADLLTGPGRGPAEADELLLWMEANESGWRS